MKYYFYIENDKINGKGQAKCLNLTCVEVTQEVYNDYEQDKYIYINGEIVLNPQFEEIKTQKERERLGKLSMTRGDVFEALILARGLTKPQIRAMIEQAEVDNLTKALYLSRFDEALSFFRGHPVFDFIGNMLNITSTQINDFFETKDYHYLTNITLKINATPSEAVVTINGVETKEFSTPYQPNLQLPVTYNVACKSYVAKEDEIMLTENTVLDVVLEKEQPTDTTETEVENTTGTTETETL